MGKAGGNTWEIPGLEEALKGLDSDKRESVFVTGDLHLGHRRIIELDPVRQHFQSIDEHDETIINRWNEVVPAGRHALVIVVGDVAFGSKASIMAKIKRLHGRKILIRGNHDGSIKGAVLKLFEFESQIYTRKINGQKVCFCHYPLLSWPGMRQGGWQIHGHSHGNTIPYGAMMDCGVGTNDFRPYTWYDVVRKMEQTPDTWVDPIRGMYLRQRDEAREYIQRLSNVLMGR